MTRFEDWLGFDAATVALEHQRISVDCADLLHPDPAVARAAFARLQGRGRHAGPDRGFRTQADSDRYGAYIPRHSASWTDVTAQVRVDTTEWPVGNP